MTGPLAIRARRVRALFACGLQEGAWPAAAHPRALLGDEERTELALASGLALRRDEDQLAAERFLFYTVVSRPTELLALSWHTADDDGDPAVPSFFVDDVAELFSPALRDATARRHLGAAEWDDVPAPSAREARRAAAAAGPREHPPAVGTLRAEPVRRALRERPAFSASALEAWASCPVKWLVERHIAPDGLQPDPEPLLRGKVAHAVLADVLQALGGDPLRPGDLPEARRLLAERLPVRAGEQPISVSPDRLRAELRRLEADLLRYLEHATSAGSDFAPHRFEHGFEGEVGGLPLRGVIDRVDVRGSEAIVYDYKGKEGYAVTCWERDRRLQMGLYLLAVRELLGLDPVGGLYQPLGDRKDTTPRGALLKGADPGRRSRAPTG